MKRSTTLKPSYIVLLCMLILGATAAQAADVASARTAGVGWLHLHQDTAGGWDAGEPFQGYALQALNETNYQAAGQYVSMRNRVLATQSARGGWTGTHQPIPALINSGMSRTAPSIIRGLDDLRADQAADGSWNGNVVDTQRAVSAFVAAGQPDNPCVTKAVQWLKAGQNADGGWGYEPGSDSDTSTYDACATLGAVVSPADDAVVKARQWIATRFEIATLGDERAVQLEALLALGDTTRAGQVASAIVAAQKADGSWEYYSGAANTYVTARCLGALRLARAAGITGLNAAIEAGARNLLGLIDANGDPAGRYVQVIETAQAAAAMIAAGQPAGASGARLRFESQLNDYYYYDFVFSGGCIDATGWGLFGLSLTDGDAGKIGRISSVLLNLQAYPAGYWYDQDSVTYTVAAMLGLAEAGMRDTPRFANGVAWLKSAFNSNMPYSASDLAWTMVLLGETAQQSTFCRNIANRLGNNQNGDGGWGEVAGQPSRIDTTAAVLIGLKAAGCGGTGVRRGCEFLVATQNADGGWNANMGLLESETRPTALAVWALEIPADPFAVSLAISTDKATYKPGETVHVTVLRGTEITYSNDEYFLTGWVTDSLGRNTELEFTPTDATHFTASYAIPEGQGADQFLVNAWLDVMGTFRGSAISKFEVRPDRPINVYPYNGSTIPTLTPVLNASDFDRSGGAVHASSRWQVRKTSSPADWSVTAYDSGERGDALTTLTLPAGALEMSSAYVWRVQYLNTSGAWTQWSLPTSFSTAGCLGSGVNWLIDHQTALGGWEVQGSVEGYLLESLCDAGLKTSTTAIAVHQRLLRMEYVNGSWPMLEYSILPGLIAFGDSPSASNLALAVKELKSRQAANGSWPDYTTKAANATYATAESLRALILAGEASSPEALKAINWLKSVRNSDSGWGLNPGVASHTCYTAPVVRALALALGKEDPFMQASYTYLKNHWQIPGSWSKMHELDAIALMGDLEYAQTSANSIIGNQLADGSWALLGGNPGDLSCTAQFLGALCRAKKLGVSVPSSVIDRAVVFLNSHVRADGSLNPVGYYARIDLSAFAAMALVAAEQAGTEAVDRAQARFLAHTDSGWHNYFALTPSYGTYSSGLAAATLAGFGDTASAALASSTANRIISEQQTDGGWGFLAKGSAPSDASYTVIALLGLKKAGLESTTAFARGVAWSQTAQQGGLIGNEYKGWLLSALAGVDQFATFRSALIADLIASQNADGGWGKTPGGPSNCQTTAAALIGLNAAGAAVDSLIRAHAWLIASQNPDTGWGEYMGALTSDVTPTALAVWALADTRQLSQIGLAVSTDSSFYDVGSTVEISVRSSQPDLDSIEGNVTDPDGAHVALTFSKNSATSYTAQYTVPADQWPGRFVVAVRVAKGTQTGAATCSFDVRLNRPINIYPSDGSMIVPITPTLVGSNFDKEGMTHAASQWQVREASSPSDWSELAFDAVDAGDVLTSITLPTGKLFADTTYAWRVRYKDNSGAWSSWSMPTRFSTYLPVSAGANWLETHQALGGGWAPWQDPHAPVLMALIRSGQQNTEVFRRVQDRVLAIQSSQGNWTEASWPIPALILGGMSPTNPQIVLGLEAIKRIQDPAGSWYQNVGNTSDAISSLAAAGQATAPEVIKGIQWLKSVQNSDGGWGYAPGEPSNMYTENAYRVIKDVMGPNDLAVLRANAWFDTYANSFAMPDWAYRLSTELEAMLERPNLSVAGRLAASLLSIQNADGSWDLIPGGPTPYTTGQVITALCKARQAGITGLDTAISKGTSYMIGAINSDGDPISAVESVLETAQAGTALVAVGRAGMPSVTAALAKFENYTSAYFSYQFISPGLCSDGHGWALLALHRMNGSAASLSKFSDNLFVAQRSSGGWEQGTWGSGLGQVGYTAQALLGLAEAGRQADSRFVKGMNWLVSSVQAGKEFTSFIKGCTLLALGDTTTWPTFRQQTVAELLATQNNDGGWGYSQFGQPSRTDSTAAALLGLYRAGDRSVAISRARQYLIATQNTDGGWAEYGGLKNSQTRMTALATWALAETGGIDELPLILTTDRRSYVGGETAHISITSVDNLDSIQGSVIDPGRAQTTLTLTQVDSTHFTASYTVPLDQWPGTYVVTVNASKGTRVGAAARSFDVGLFRPINIQPYDHGTTVSLSPTLQATDFDNSETTATHAASQWQVRDIASDPDYSQTVFDSGVDTSHRTSITVPIGVLRHGQTYAWTVRYRDSLGRWSAWSLETEFTTIPASQWGERIVFDMDGDIWVMSTTGSEPARLTAGPARDSSPRISPDGQWVAFSSDQGGPYQIWLMHPDGSGLRALTTFQSGNPITLDWSPASDRLAASGLGDSLYIVPLSGAVSRVLYLPLTQFRHVAWSSQNKIAVELSPFGNASYTTSYTLNPDGSGLIGVGVNSKTPAWTPDGSFVTFGSNSDIWRSKPDGSTLARITSGADVEAVPAWSSDAATLFYRSYPALNPGVSTLVASAADGSRPVSLKYYNAAIGSLDTGVIALGSNMPPAQPAAVSPAEGALNVSLVPVFQASVFSDPNAGDTHAASHWQVRLASESYETAVIDEVSQAELTAYTVVAGSLVPGQHYFWRVCYTDNHGNIGPWSAESGFTTLPGPSAVQDKVLIVAGGGSFTGNPIVEQTKYLAGYAWCLSRSRQIPAAQIDILSAFPMIDANGDGNNEVSAAATRQSLLAALNPSSGFAAGCDKLIVYMVDHGVRDGDSYYFRINPTESISAADLDAALDALQAARPAMKIAIVFDFCYSGGFVIGCAPAADQYRICVSGSTQESLAIFSGSPIAGVSFSNFFFDGLLQGATFKCAFDAAREGILAAYIGPPNYPQQVPWLEDDGDGVISSKFDGQRAREFYWGSTSAYGLSAPLILSVTPDQNIGANSSVKLSAEIAEGYAVQRVWATIVAPSASYADGEPITTVREVNLTREGTTRIWSTTISDLVEAGDYHITYYARGYDSSTITVAGMLQAGTPDTLVSMPRPTVISKDKASRNAIQMPWTLYR